MSIRRRRIDVLQTLKQRRVSTGLLLLTFSRAEFYNFFIEY